MKQYSTEIITDPFASPSTTTESVMAGTVHGFTGFPPTAFAPINMPHFVNVSITGAVVNSEVYLFSGSLTYYTDVRTVDIVGDRQTSNAIYYMTCLARPYNGYGNDRIVIIPVDNSGTIPTGKTAFSITLNDPDEGLYPLHSIYHSNGYLYVCGYTTDDNTNQPSVPSFNGYDHKQSFVMKIDVSNNTVVATHKLNTTYTPAVSLPISPRFDYDIAMRLVELASGDIFVTGSVNDVKSDGASSIAEHSATMNLVLDANLSLVPVNEDHFTFTSQAGTAQNEYGVGLVEDGANQYVVGNYFYQQTTSPLPTEFSVYPAYLYINHLTGFNHDAVTITSRYKLADINYSWALQTLPVDVGPNGGTYKHLLIAGMEVDEMCSYSGTGASPNNILPYLFSAEADYSSTFGINVAFNTWTSYSNTTGTGVTSGGQPNNYMQLGGGISNMGWNPTFAARYDINSNPILSAPKWNPAGSGLLSLKTFDVDPIATPAYWPSEPCGPLATATSRTVEPPSVPTSCSPNFYYENVDGLGVTITGPTTYTVTPTHSTLGALTVSSETPTVASFGYTDDYCYLTNNYKLGAAGVAAYSKRPDATQAYPNPAQNDITILPAKDIADDAEMEISLTNLYGQVIAKLYKGRADGLGAGRKLLLPNVPVGLYMLQGTINGQAVLKQKLSIQQ